METSKWILLTLLLCLPQNALGQSQDRNANVTYTEQGWATEISLGLDVLSNLFINPSIGGGTNRLGFGGSLRVFTNYNAGKFSWANNLQTDLGVQKTGSGPINDSTTTKIPFQKNIDNLWFNTQASLRTSYFSKFYYSATLFFGSQLAPSYKDGYLSPLSDDEKPVAEFLSPALLQFALGMDYRPNDFISIFAAPLSYKSIIVANDDIADDIAFDDLGNILGTTHGNPFEVNDNDTITIEKYSNQLGPMLRVDYTNTFWDKFKLRSNLLLFSKYGALDKVDVNWRNTIDLMVLKKFSLSLFSLLSYDHDVLVQITDNDSPKGLNGVGRRVSYSQQILLKYTFTFD